MALAGKYELVKSDGYLEHILAVGVPEEMAKKAQDQKSLEISINGDQVKIDRGNGRDAPLTLGKETEEKAPDGKIMKNKATLNGNVLKVESNTDGGQWSREYTLVGSELTVISSSSKPGVPVGKRMYKKL